MRKGKVNIWSQWQFGGGEFGISFFTVYRLHYIWGFVICGFCFEFWRNEGNLPLVIPVVTPEAEQQIQALHQTGPPEPPPK